MIMGDNNERGLSRDTNENNDNGRMIMGEW